MTKQFLYLLFLGFFVLACHGKVTEEPVAPPKPEQEKPPCLTCNYDEESPGVASLAPTSKYRKSTLMSKQK